MLHRLQALCQAEAAASRDSVIESLSTSLSITDHTANLCLLTPPLIPFPNTVLLHADPALLLELTKNYHDFFYRSSFRG